MIDISFLTGKYKRKYNHSKSSTYVPNGGKYLAMYGTGSALGVYSYETVSIANLTVDKQIFIEAVSLDGWICFKLKIFTPV